MIVVCETCGATDLSWVDQRFGHCRRSTAGRPQRLDDARVEGVHPGLGYVADAADLARKVEAAKRAGKIVQRAEDIPDPGARPRVETGKPTAWQRTLEFVKHL